MLSALVLILALAVSPSDPAAVRLTRLDGRVAEGRLVAWEPNGIRLEMEAGVLEVDPDELLEMRWMQSAAPSAGGVAVRLVDGSQFKIREAPSPITPQGTLSIAIAGADEPLEVPTRLVRSIEFEPRRDGSAAVWEELDRADRGEDLLVVKKKDDGALDSIAGVVKQITDETVDFIWDGEPIAIKRSKVAAVGFHRGGASSSADAACELTLLDGSRLFVKGASLHGGVVRLRLLAGGVDATIPLSRLQRADFSAGKIAYLSDLPAVESAWSPYVADPPEAPLLAEQGVVRRDESFDGAPLALESRPLATAARRSNVPSSTFAKGLALRSGTVTAYRIPEGMTRFTAKAAIDPVTAREGNVELAIWGNGRVLWRHEVVGGAAPVEIDVALEGARRLELRVDYGGNRDFGDRLHLVEARVTR